MQSNRDCDAADCWNKKPLIVRGGEGVKSERMNGGLPLP